MGRLHRLLLATRDIGRNHSAQVLLDVRSQARILLVSSRTAAILLKRPDSLLRRLSSLVSFAVLVALPPICSLASPSSSSTCLIVTVAAICLYVLLFHR